jgi:hypothetical protein
LCEALETRIARAKAEAAIPLRANDNDGTDLRREPSAKPSEAAPTRSGISRFPDAQLRI